MLPIMATSERPVLIKKYGNLRLYRPGAGCYVSLADLADMVEDAEDFVVCDAATGADITQSVLKAIIIERAGHG
jgi:polyhydroxyalkanoate synthesis repressor PhaR